MKHFKMFLNTIVLKFYLQQNYRILLYGVGFVLWLYWIWSRRHFYRFAWTFPGSFGIPLLGNLYYGRSLQDVLVFAKKLFEKHNSHTVHFWIGVSPIILTSDPIFLEKVLTLPELLNKPQIYKVLKHLGGNGLLSLSASEWQIHRKKLNPSFNHQVLVSFLPIFHNARKNVAEKLETMADDKQFHGLAKLFFQTSMNISLETIMGKSSQENGESYDTFTEKFEYLIQQISLKGVLSYFKLDILYVLQLKYILYRKYFQNFMMKPIDEKINQLNCVTKREESAEDDTSDDNFNIKKKPQIFVDQILQFYKSNEFTLEDVVAESNHILAASFETTAINMFSALVFIAMHPHVQERLYEELVDVFPNKDVKMEFEHMEQLPYLEMVIKETLRILPPVGIIGRHVVEDTKIDDNCTLPKGVEIVISLYHLHRRTDIWGPNADKFDPDHFLPDNERNLHKFAYIPFSSGIRNCIGWRYALFVMRSMISGIIQNYRLECDMKFEEIEMDVNISFKFKKEPLLRMHRREQ